MMDWRPIETAPKDEGGEIILLCDSSVHRDDYSSYVRLGFWTDAGAYGAAPEGFWADWGAGINDEIGEWKKVATPTHWMPQPEFPYDQP